MMKLVGNDLVSRLEILLEEDSLNIKFAYSGIMDIFNYCLSEDEAKEIIKPYKYHLTHESKFIECLRYLFKLNSDYKCIVNLRSPLMKLYKFKKDRLNGDEIELYNFIQSQKVNWFIVENEKELDFFVRLSTQEIHFCDYIFDNENVIINGNYDLSFPIYYQDQEYKEIIEMNNLHVRSW